MKKNKINENKKIYLILAALILLTFIIIYWDFVSGNRVFMYSGSDDSRSYVPFYSCIINKLRSGDFSSMALDYGIGTDMFSYQQVIFDPFALIIYIFGFFFGTKSTPYLLIICNFLRIFLSGFFCYKLLFKFSNNKYTNLITAYVYAFNGYIMLWVQHYFFATCLVLLPIIILIIENILKAEKMKWQDIVVFSAMICILCLFSVYFAYMILLFSAFYILLRLIYIYNDKKIIFVKIVQCCLCVFLGIGLSAAIFFPSASAILFTGSRVSGGGSIFEKILRFMKMNYSGDYYYFLLGRIFSNNFFSDINSGFYFENPQLFFSILNILLIPQFCINTIKKNKTNLKGMIVFIVSIILLVCMFILPLGSACFNAFADVTGRHSFLLIPIFAIVMTITINDIVVERKINYNAMFLSGIVMEVFFIYVFFSYIDNRNTYVIAMADFIIVAIIMIVLLLIKNKKIKKQEKKSYIFLICVLFINIVFENYPTVNGMEEYAKAYKVSDIQGGNVYFSDNTNNAVEYISERDKSFYRINKDYFNIDCNDSMVENYNGFSSYCSNDNKFYREFLNLVYTETYQQEPGLHIPDYRFQDRLVRYLNGKYFISKSQISNLNLVTSFDDVNVYENINYQPVFSVFDSVISRTEFDKMNEYDKQNAILENAILEEQDATKFNIYCNDNLFESEDKIISSDSIVLGDKMIDISDKDSDIKSFGSSDGYDFIEFPINHLEDDGTAILFECEIKSTQYGNIILSWDDGCGYDDVNIGAYNSSTRIINQDVDYVISKYLEGTVKSIRIYYNLQKISFKNYHFYTQTSDTTLYNEKNKNSIINSMDYINDGNIKSDISVFNEGILFISIPYSNAWKLTIDGEETEIIRTTIGFMGAYIGEGNHTVSLTYTPLGFKLGLIVSATSLAIIVVISILLRVRMFRIKKDKNKEAQNVNRE